MDSDSTQVVLLRERNAELVRVISGLKCAECDHEPHAKSCITCGCQANYTEGIGSKDWAILSKGKGQ